MEKPDKREEIVRAALALIAVHGFHGAPLAMIADRAGVATGTVYLYFESKDALIAEIYRELEDRIYHLIMEGYAPEKTVRERFLHLGTALLRYFIDNPLDFRYLVQYHHSPYGVAFHRNGILGQKRNYGVYRELFAEVGEENFFAFGLDAAEADALKFGIVGCGFVGNSAADAMVLQGVASEILLVDLARSLARAQAEETPFSHPVRLEAEDYPDLRGASLIVLACGVAQKPGENIPASKPLHIVNLTKRIWCYQVCRMVANRRQRSA